MRKYHRKKTEQESLYRYEAWKITEDEFTIENNHHNEAIFALGNGYMGVRGTLEEDYNGPADTTTPGIYINGVYGSEEIIYGEDTPALPKKGQTILNLADWTSINLYLDDERFDMLRGEVSDYRRTLDMKKGILTRELIWTGKTGKKIRIKITRLISLVNKHTGIIIYSFTPVNFSGNVRIISALNGDVQNYHFPRNKKLIEVADSGFEEKAGYILQTIPSTGIDVGIAVQHQTKFPKGTDYRHLKLIEDDKLLEQFEIDVKKGEEYKFIKFANLFSSKDIRTSSKDKEGLQKKLINNLDSVVRRGWQQLLTEQEEFLEEYWDDVDVKIYGDQALQQAFRFNAFHLLQSTGRDGKTNVAAKGLTGEYYEGHYFWDTETYILPFYLFSKPEMARQLLLYRYNTLDQARANARRMKLDGALYSWRTINGDEASGFFMGSTVQYHIDADIAYAIYQYFTATQDREFMYNYGAEILVETARMWASRGSYIPLKGNKFCFNEVCGPDEYKPGVNNNCYTNYMAKFNLEYSLKVLNMMKEESPQNFNRLKEKVNLQEKELGEWEKAARNIYLPYNEELGIHPQDGSFLYKDPIDVDSIPEEEIPLVRNWHPLVIWRYQVIKQADVVLLMLLQGDKFSQKQKRANYDYYEPKTTHDSSLSPAIYSIIASEIGYHEDAYNYFMQTARLDLDDYNGNAFQGVHTACMAGSWMAMVKGFAGMRNYDGQLYFNPYLPDKWEGYEFKIRFQGRKIKVKVDRNGVDYKLLEGDRITIKAAGEEKELKPANQN